MGDSTAGRMQPSPYDQIARLTTFATIGLVGATNELARTALAGIDGADAEIVAEETICLVALTTARAAEVGLREAPPEIAAAVVPALVHAPFTYRDYLVGEAMLVQQNPNLRDDSGLLYQRLERKHFFYLSHFPAGAFPGERTLTDKMGLWMGRISPPKLPESPMARLDRLGAVGLLLTHLKLVLAFARHDLVR